MKPSWDQAPEWATCLAQQNDGSWWWFSKEPEIFNDRWYSYLKDKHEPHKCAEHWEYSLDFKPHK